MSEQAQWAEEEERAVRFQAIKYASVASVYVTPALQELDRRGEEIERFKARVAELEAGVHGGME
jgi:hypothetical protein